MARVLLPPRSSRMLLMLLLLLLLLDTGTAAPDRHNQFRTDYQPCGQTKETPRGDTAPLPASPRTQCLLAE